MTAQPNLSHWLQTAPAFAAEVMDLPRQVDIAILGAGIMGCAAAYWLTRHGRRPLVIERNAHPAGGATGRNGGLMVAGPTHSYHLTGQQLGPEAARAIMRATLLNRELLAAVLTREGIEAAYARRGFLVIATEAEVAQLKATVSALNADGFEGEWLDRAAAEKQVGTTLGPEYVGAAFAPGDGQLHSARYTFGVAEAARRGGASFAFSTPAQTVEPGPGGHSWRVRTTRGEVRCEQLVITLNAWAGELLPSLKRLISPTRGHVILTGPVAFRGLTPWVANAGWDYGRQLDDGRLLIGGQRVSRPDRDMGHAPPLGENVPPVEPEVVAALTRMAPRLFPALANVPIVHHWTGTMAFTPDEQPLVGPWPGQAGLWLMVGFSGHGMPFSQVLPAAIAARLTGQAGPAIPAAFDPARFISTDQPV